MMMKLSGTGKVFSTRVIVVIAIIIGLTVGYGLGYMQLQPQVKDLRASLAKTQANLDKTQMLLLATEADLNDTLQRLQSTQGELSTTTDQLKSLTLTVTQVKKGVSNLDKDRLLLIELRKDLPETRAEAKAYWNNVKRLAVNANPALGPSVDKIIAQIDAYFDWLDAMPIGGTSETFLEWLYDDYYYVYAAYGYSDAIATFNNEALLVVVIHIDMAVELIS